MVVRWAARRARRVVVRRASEHGGCCGRCELELVKSTMSFGISVEQRSTWSVECACVAKSAAAHEIGMGPSRLDTLPV